MSSDFDDSDFFYEDPLGAKDADLEARFRALEREDEIEEMRARMAREGAYDEEPPQRRGRGGEPGPSRRSSGGASAEERFVLLLCSHCGGKNRTSLARLQRDQLPRCGRCRKDLYFSR